MAHSTDSEGFPVMDKVATARLDYSFDFKAWLQGVGDTIASATIEADDASDLVVEASTHAGGVVTAFVSGGTAGQVSSLTCTITTAAGRIDARMVKIAVKAAR